VMFHIILENKQTRESFELDFHDEIRWSHKRFSGSPEAKLYKDFYWSDVPFFRQIIKEEQYQKVGIMGEGGFGIVYKAIKKLSGEVVAYKELTNIMGSVQDHEYDRFRREVRIQSELNHPNIVPILDHDLSASSPWFTMPLAQCNLTEMLEDGVIRQNLQRLNNIYGQILEGIKYAHGGNVVHRDLKPENILLFENGQIKISDFGLGKQLDSTSLSLSLTNTSESMGSYQYAAPEQWKSFKDADFRSDIYALGKILYNCLTGEVPFPNLDVNLVAPCYRAVIVKCTENDPAARFQSVDELIKVFKNSS
jgi:eukaryotic-like serine/threonine-protein kinase